MKKTTSGRHRLLLAAVALAQGLFLPAAVSAQLVPDDRYTLYADHVLVSPGEIVSLGIRINSVNGANGTPEQIDGWSLGLCHDGSALSLDSVSHSPLAQALNGGNPLAFSAITIYAEGFTDGVLIDFMGIHTLPQGLGYPLYEVFYEAGLSPGTTPVHFCELGTPAVLVLIATGLTDNLPIRNSGSVEILSEPYFIRGDCDNNTGVNLADTIYLLQRVFPPVGTNLTMDCADACDCNDDGSLNLSDAIWSLNAVLGSPSIPLPGPYPQCGSDVATDTLNCGGSISGCP